MSTFSKKIGKKFIYTTEVKPPRGTNTKPFIDEIKAIKKIKGLTSVNVIDSPSARLFMSSLGASIMLEKHGLEPIFQMVCRDRNSLALESDLISASAFGIENILSLTGDHPQRGASDHPKTQPVFELDSTTLIKTITLMNQGTNLMGQELDGKTNFFVGAALSPSSTPSEPEILKTKRKMDAGARFFQTQAVFQVKTVEEFFDKSDKILGDIRPVVLAGTIPLVSEKMIAFLNRLPGIRVPEDVASRIAKSKDPVEEGISMTMDLIDGIKSQGLGGVHIMPVGRIGSLRKIMDSI
ncbi:MAG: methylenetetrahydrofolate reductase [Candidatus Altiarchaeota archaeon]|nr:methylenetetrahydrofolate reductase [Candidatus Altiarchaeota archaeon]